MIALGKKLKGYCWDGFNTFFVIIGLFILILLILLILVALIVKGITSYDSTVSFYFKDDNSDSSNDNSDSSSSDSSSSD
jgi:hypothetical protein